MTALISFISISQRQFDDLSFRFANQRESLLHSYSHILGREDDQAERLADIAKAYTVGR